MTTELIATLIEVTDSASIRLAKLWAKKGSSMPKPVSIPRPWDTRRGAPLTMSDPRVRAFFGGRVRYSPKKSGDD